MRLTLLAVLFALIPLLTQALVIRGVTQGSAQTTEDPCGSYEKCGAKGLQIWNILHSNLSSPTPYVRGDTSAIFNMYYQAEPQPYKVEDSEMQQEFEQHRFDTKHLDLWTTVSKDPTVPSLVENIDDAPYKNVLDTNQGIVIADANFQSFNTNQKLPWSEIIYNLSHLAVEEADHQHELDPAHPPGGPTSNLKYIIQHIVVNQESLNVLELAYQRNGYTYDDGSAEAAIWWPWSEEDLGHSVLVLCVTWH
ncbi:MAG: hypothetical protein L6R37_007368 [Teloschistes peruensis]|nr:MAG: hypothetical protein L6R37_007368 [Teloschistes peruensis]